MRTRSLPEDHKAIFICNFPPLTYLRSLQKPLLILEPLSSVSCALDLLKRSQ